MNPKNRPASASGVLLMTLTLAAVGLSPLEAQGFECTQRCSAGACSQSVCDVAQGAGFCACRNGSLPWSDTVYASWCRASGKPPSKCAAPLPLQDAAGKALAQPPAAVPHADALMAALASRNPYVATLVTAMLEEQQWADGPVEGLVHESRSDEQSGVVLHSQAIRFVGQVIQGGVNAAQLTVTVLGDLGMLAFLSQAAGSAGNKGPVAPRTIQGVILEGGLHGSLAVIGGNGQSETVQW